MGRALKRLFHVSDPPSAESLLAGEALAPPSLATEGFVHLSFAAQLAGTLALHFRDAAALTLLELDARRVGAPALRLERSRGGERFPHLYRPLEVHDVVRSWPLARDASGTFVVPDLGT